MNTTAPMSQPYSLTMVGYSPTALPLNINDTGEKSALSNHQRCGTRTYCTKVSSSDSGHGGQSLLYMVLPDLPKGKAPFQMTSVFSVKHYDVVFPQIKITYPKILVLLRPSYDYPHIFQIIGGSTENRSPTVFPNERNNSCDYWTSVWQTEIIQEYDRLTLTVSFPARVLQSSEGNRHMTREEYVNPTTKSRLNETLGWWSDCYDARPKA